MAHAQAHTACAALHLFPPSLGCRLHLLVLLLLLLCCVTHEMLLG
jgi:hypothetical protein